MRELPPTPSSPLVRRSARRAGLLGGLVLATACHRAPPPGAEQRSEAPPPPPQQVGAPVVPSELAPPPAETPPAASAAGSAAPPPYTGPYFAVTDSSAGVYGDMTFTRKQKIGYLRSGSRVPSAAQPIVRDDCPRGWYRLRDGGFVCGSAGTTNLSSPE